MSSHRQLLEEKIDQLPTTSRTNVRNFLEYLFEKNADDPSFLLDIDAACQAVFDRYEQAHYATWQELQQALLFRFSRWLPPYEGKMDRRTILERIATNLLIDAARTESLLSEYGESVGEVSNLRVSSTVSERNIYRPKSRPNSFRRKSGKKVKQTWSGALREFRDRYSSVELQKKALEWRGD